VNYSRGLAMPHQDLRGLVGYLRWLAQAHHRGLLGLRGLVGYSCGNSRVARGGSLRLSCCTAEGGGTDDIAAPIQTPIQTPMGLRRDYR
jgi:hypothetical protein